MERIAVASLIVIFLLTVAVGMSLNLFVDPEKVRRLKRRSVLLYGPMVPEEILTYKGLIVAKLRNALIVAWLVLLVATGIMMSLKNGS